jgi:uncharacterized protein with FMN-binding domain
MKKGVKILIIVAAMLAVIVIVVIVTINSINKNLENLNNITIENVDLTEIEDGTYNGSYECLPVSVEVAVTVNNHEITSIEIIKHLNGQGQPAEVIIDDVIEAQSLDVDTITGATYSSQVILLAIQDALDRAGE